MPWLVCAALIVGIAFPVPETSILPWVRQSVGFTVAGNPSDARFVLIPLLMLASVAALRFSVLAQPVTLWIALNLLVLLNQPPTWLLPQLLICLAGCLPLLVRGRQREWLMDLVAILCLVHMTVAILAPAFVPQFRTGGLSRLSGFYGSPNDVYPVAVIAAVIGINRWLSSSRRDSVAILLALSGTLVALGTFSRAAAVALAAVSGVSILLYRPSIKNRLAVLSMSATVIAGQLVARNFGSQSEMGWNSAVSRLALWDMSFRHWLTSPLFGNGGRSFTTTEAWRTMERSSFTMPTEPKGLPFLFLEDYGLAGLMIVAAFIFAVRPSSIKQVEGAGTENNLLLLTLTALAAMGIFDCPILSDANRLPGEILIVSLIGISLAVLPRKNPPTEPLPA